MHVPMASAPIATLEPSVALHVVFSAECIPAFDWQSVGLFFSFYRVRQPGRITRLLACSEEQLKQYPKENMDIGPTFVHRNMRFDHANDGEIGDPFHDQKGTGYASYNKPYSVSAWLEANDVGEEFILMMDTDMFFRAPVDPVALGATLGNVVSAEYTYLVGTSTGFASRFIDASLHKRFAQVGGFHIFHREDLRAIAPLWLEYTKRVRTFANANPETFFNESFRTKETDAYKLTVSHMQARWHTEMYGYVFAAAEVGVTHRIRRDVMLYPGYEPYLGRPPMIMHYGADFHLGEAYFNKMSYQQLKLEECPAFLFDDPKMPIERMDKRDALAMEHLANLNAAFCGFYERIGCQKHQMPPRCGTFDSVLSEVQPAIQKCVDEHEGCGSWANAAECTKNPKFMHAHCGVACQSCDRPLDELDPSEIHYGDWKYTEKVLREQWDYASAYIAGASEGDLDRLAEAIDARREELAQKHEL